MKLKKKYVVICVFNKNTNKFGKKNKFIFLTEEQIEEVRNRYELQHGAGSTSCCVYYQKPSWW